MLRKNNVFQKLAGLWLVAEVVNHVGLYGSKVAEGYSAFQRRSCDNLRCCQWQKFNEHDNIYILGFRINLVFIMRSRAHEWNGKTIVWFIQ